jgi:hypothetical protein
MRLAQKPKEKRTGHETLFSVMCLYKESRISRAGKNRSWHQASAGTQARFSEIDVQRSIERELKWQILFLTPSGMELQDARDVLEAA